MNKIQIQSQVNKLGELKPAQVERLWLDIQEYKKFIAEVEKKFKTEVQEGVYGNTSVKRTDVYKRTLLKDYKDLPEETKKLVKTEYKINTQLLKEWIKDNKGEGVPEGIGEVFSHELVSIKEKKKSEKKPESKVENPLNNITFKKK